MTVREEVSGKDPLRDDREYGSSRDGGVLRRTRVSGTAECRQKDERSQEQECPRRGAVSGITECPRREKRFRKGAQPVFFGPAMGVPVRRVCCLFGILQTRWDTC